MKRKQTDDIISRISLESIEGLSLSIPHATQLTHLQFRRFAGCPMCNLHIQSFINRHAELLAHNLQVVAVFHSTREAMLKYHASAPFPLIADPSRSLYRTFGVESSIRSILSPAAWRAGIKGLLRHGLNFPARGESALGLPAEFLIDTNGRIIASKYGMHAYDQWSVEELLVMVRNFTYPFTCV